MADRRECEYVFVNLAGTPYRIGMQQAEAIKSIPGFTAFFTSPPPEWTDSMYAEVEELYRRACPDLLEEIQGLADGLKVQPGRIFYHSATYLVPPCCSHFALLPGITACGRPLVGRSYEFGPDTDDRRLCLTRPQGRFSHLGFSSLLLGRSDGMNDQGLVVTMSSGGIPVGILPGLQAPIQKGLQFWAVIRSLLENCRDVNEGLDWLKQIPCGGNPILILTDRSGKAARVEVRGPALSIETVDVSSPVNFVCAANHYTGPELEPFSSPALRNSVVRRQRIIDLVNRSAPSIDKEDIRQTLSTLYPQGLCTHFYRECFGTMYSMIADPSEGSLDVCFGSPAVNPWTTFTLNETEPFKVFSAVLPQADDFADFWG